MHKKSHLSDGFFMKYVYKTKNQKNNRTYRNVNMRRFPNELHLVKREFILVLLYFVEVYRCL
jgi:hypothetical protein